jgi:8-oxo-dGTP pyrophosphatase MutT (NUDIX family)
MDPGDLYERLAKREVYVNPWVALEVHDIVHPTGAPGEHALVVTPQASAALVVDGAYFIFARQPRFAARSWQIEIVKGGAGRSEDALGCAKRELREELGLEAERWEPLGFVYEIPSIVQEPVVIFVASGVTATAADPEEVERIETVRMPIGDAYAAAADGRINDAVTLAALLRYRLRSATGS